MNIKKSLLAVLILGCAAQLNASQLDNAQLLQNKIINNSANSQVKINKSADKALKLKAEIEQLQEANQNLRQYRDHLAALVSHQESEKNSLLTQIAEVDNTRQGVVPLMYKMIKGLQAQLDQDMPIKPSQRQLRINKLNKMMVQADISDAEKYRRILEAYQIEMDYGTKLGLYQGEITLQGKQLEVELLYLGRLALVARSLNGEQFWSWNKQQKAWNKVSQDHANQIDVAFAIASKQQTPSLITLPISISETTQRLSTQQEGS